MRRRGKEKRVEREMETKGGKEKERGQRERENRQGDR